MLFKSVGFVLNILIPPLQLLYEVTAVHGSVLLVAFLNATVLVFPVHPVLLPYYSGQKSEFLEWFCWTGQFLFSSL